MRSPKRCIKALVPLWDKCFSVSGDYLEVQCVPSATHVPCTLQSQNEVLAVTVFVTLFLKYLCSWNFPCFVCVLIYNTF
jgi:hypothetical protein